MYEFEADTRFTAAGEGRWQWTVADRWNVGTVPNGGYLIAAAARAMAQASAHPDPLTMTGHYLRPATPGPATIEVTAVKRGGTFDNLQASVYQDGSERCRFLAAFGTLERIAGPSWREGEPPALPAPEACVAAPAPLAIGRRYQIFYDPACAGWLRGDTGGPAELRAWIGHADGRPPDLSSLLLYADALPPPVFNRVGPKGWVPTVELTVHLRARPAPGLLRCRFRTRYVTRGLLESDGELWDAEGELVALSRQLALLRG